MSDPKPSTAVARPAENPAPKTSSSATWILLAGAAVLCGGVIALAFSGNEERSQPTLADEVDYAVPAAAPAVEPPAPPPAAPMTLATASQSISIEMYSATWCQACQAAHRWMDQEGIAYHTIDVDRQASAQAQLSMLNPHRTLPTFDIDGQVLVGFDQVALTSAIDGAARRHPR
ncbi:MAG: glutaredoxin family protein [Sandaracinus sp.]